MRLLSLLFFVPLMANAAGTYHLSPDGDDHASGDADHPWQTLAVHMDGTPNFPQVHAGDTVVIGGGTYRIQRERATSEHRMVLRPGANDFNAAGVDVVSDENAVFTARLEAFEDPIAWQDQHGETAWVQCKPGPYQQTAVGCRIPGLTSQNVWRTRRSIWSYDNIAATDAPLGMTHGERRNHSADPLFEVAGSYPDALGRSQALVTYSSSEKAQQNSRSGLQWNNFLSTDSHVLVAGNDTIQRGVYVGPGVFATNEAGTDNDYVFVRLDGPTAFDGGGPEDPNKAALHLFNYDDGISFESGMAHMTMKGVGFHDMGRVVLEDGVHDMTFLGNDFVLPGLGYFGINDHTWNVTVRDAWFTAQIPDYIHRSDIKYDIARTFDIPLILLGDPTGVHPERPTNVSIQDSVLERAFYGVSVNAADTADLGHLTIRDMLDDGILFGRDVTNVQVHDSHVQAYAPFSSSTSLVPYKAPRTTHVDLPAPWAGSVVYPVYLHHNVAVSTAVRCGRPKVWTTSNPSLRPADHLYAGRGVTDEFDKNDNGWCTNRIIGTHGTTPPSWAVYNNTFVTGTDHKFGTYLGTSSTNQALPGFLFNNVVVQLSESGRMLGERHHELVSEPGSLAAGGNLYIRLTKDVSTTLATYDGMNAQTVQDAPSAGWTSLKPFFRMYTPGSTTPLFFDYLDEFGQDTSDTFFMGDGVEAQSEFVHVDADTLTAAFLPDWTPSSAPPAGIHFNGTKFFQNCETWATSLDAGSSEDVLVEALDGLRLYLPGVRHCNRGHAE